MNGLPRFHVFRRGILLLFGVAGVLACGTSPLMGQQNLESAWLNYRQAEIDYGAKEETRDSIRDFQLRALDGIDVARASGQNQRLQSALAAAQSQGSLLSRAEVELNRSRNELREAGAALLSGLQSWATELEANLRRPNQPATVVSSWTEALRQTRANIAEVEATLRQVEEAVAPIGIIPVEWDPRTGPEEYGYFADLYEDRARNLSALIADSDARIRQYENLIALQREQQRDALYESNPTGGRLSPIGGTSSAADPLPGQIALEREKRAIYVAARDGYLEQARRARAFAEGRGP